MSKPLPPSHCLPAETARLKQVAATPHSAAEELRACGRYGWAPAVDRLADLIDAATKAD